MSVNKRKNISAAEHNRENESAANESINPRTNSQNIDELSKEADKKRSRKPGSQSNSAKRHNNGRGGGK